jgi:hypothetical protein
LGFGDVVPRQQVVKEDSHRGFETVGDLAADFIDGWVAPYAVNPFLFLRT